VTEEEIKQFAAGLPGAAVETASEASGAPEAAWGDTFIYFDGPGPVIPPERRWPFATIVVHDYKGFDESSDLDREGVFRLNVSAGRETFTELIGYPPAEHPQRAADADYAVLDTVIPHPAYGQQGWVSILNPGPRTSEQARALITASRNRAAARHRADGPPAG
jgi:hypothetical protein